MKYGFGEGVPALPEEPWERVEFVPPSGQGVYRSAGEIVVERCGTCGDPVEVMCQRGTGYCSQFCQEEAEAIEEATKPPVEEPHHLWGSVNGKERGSV